MDIHASGAASPRLLPSALRLTLFFILTLFGAGLLLVGVLHESYKAASRQAELEAGNMSSVLEARLLGVMRRAQADLEEIAVTLPKGALVEGGQARYREEVSRRLVLHAAHFPEVVGFRVLNERGDVLYASEHDFHGASAADRSYFLELKADPKKTLFFSEVIMGRISGRPIMVMAVPIRDSLGRFLGIVMAPLDLGLVRQMFATLDLGANGVTTLRRTDDGRLVQRWPELPEAVNRPLSNNPLHMLVEKGGRAGNIRYQSALDGFERLYAFQRIGEYPFYVASGIATDDYLASWRRTAVLVGMFALVLVLSLTLVLIRLLRVERAEADIAARLADSEARYRMLAENSHDVIWTLDLPSRRFTYISPSILQLRGYTVKEAMAQSLADSLAPSTLSDVMAQIDERLRRIANGDQAARVVRSELEQTCKGGGTIITEVVSTCLTDTDGVPKTLLGITRDISQRKAAELALRDSNQRLQERIEEIGRLQVALQELAVRDGLTGLYNRRYLDETLEREVARARREGTPLALVMLDIDHFKRVNDTYGHQMGDEVLKMLARTLVGDIRVEDVACRYGGEEFLILMPRMPLEAALQRAETWRQAVAGLSIAYGDFHISFTISLGVSAYPEYGKTPDELTRCADQALYRAKAEGRNRVSVLTPG